MEEPTSQLRGSTPRHQQLRELITEMARPGELIPSERALATTYGVSRSTVREAIGALVNDGLLERVQGLGTFGRQPRLESRLHLASFTEDMQRRGRRPSTRVLRIAAKVPPAEVAASLNLAKGATAWHLDRLRLANDEPLAIESGWYPCALLPDLDSHDLSTSLYGVLAEHYGLAIDAATQTVWAEGASESQGALLRTPSGTPLLVFRRRSTARGLALEHVVSHYRGDRYQLVMDLDSSLPR